MGKTLTEKQMEECLTAQQGEIDAVYLYKKLAGKVKEEADRNAFIRLAGNEARHAEVFRKYTNRDLKPKKTKGVVVPLLYKLLGKKKVYPIIAKAEYAAAEKYKHLLPDFPEVETVMQDEVHHGDAVKGLLK